MFVVEATESRTEEAMKNLIQRFIREEEGQDLVEYALLLLFIALAVVGILNLTAGAITELFEDVNTGIGQRPA